MSEVFLNHWIAAVAIWAGIALVLGIAAVVVDLLTDWDE